MKLLRIFTRSATMSESQERQNHEEEDHLSKNEISKMAQAAVTPTGSEPAAEATRTRPATPAHGRKHYTAEDRKEKEN